MWFTPCMHSGPIYCVMMLVRCHPKQCYSKGCFSSKIDVHTSVETTKMDVVKVTVTPCTPGNTIQRIFPLSIIMHKGISTHLHVSLRSA